MADVTRILIVEDLHTDAELSERECRKVLPRSEFLRVETQDEFISALTSFAPDLILSDYKLPQFDGMTALTLTLAHMPETPFIILTGSMNEDIAVECMKAGAWDYVIKEHMRRLGLAVLTALDKKQARWEQKLAEESLRVSEGRYRDIVENAKEGIFQRRDHKFITVNKAYADMLGYDSPEEVMRRITDVARQLYVHQEDYLRLKEMVAEHDYVHGFETELYKKDGSRIWVSINLQAVRDSHGEWLYNQGIYEDITLKKQAEHDRLQNMERLQEALEGTIHAIASLIETRDAYTAGHQRRVANLAMKIAAKMNFPQDQIIGLRMACTIHDIGKVSVPSDILNKPGKLNDIEFSLIKMHSQTGYDILKDIDFPWPIARIVLEHHERINGTGYPKGLRGNELLIESCIIAAADVVEAMASHRPYRPGLGIENAMEEIAGNKGILYNLEVANACLALFHEGESDL